MVAQSAHARAPLPGAFYCIAVLALMGSVHAIANGVYDGGGNEHVAIMYIPWDYANAQAALNRSATCSAYAHVNGGTALSYYGPACTISLINSEQFTSDPFYHNRLIITAAHCTTDEVKSTANGTTIAGKTFYNKVIFDTLGARLNSYYMPNASVLRHYIPTGTCKNTQLLNIDDNDQPESTDPRVYYATKLLFDKYNGMTWDAYRLTLQSKSWSNQLADDYAVWLLDRPVEFGSIDDPFGEAFPQPITGSRVATPDEPFGGKTLDMVGFGIEGYGTFKNANGIWVGTDPNTYSRNRRVDDFRKNATLDIGVRSPVSYSIIDKGASNSSKGCAGDSGAAVVESGQTVDIIRGIFAWAQVGAKYGAFCNSVSAATRVDIPEFYCDIKNGLEADMASRMSGTEVNAITKAYCDMGAASTASTVSVARIPANGKPRPAAVDVAHHPDTHGAHVLLWILVAVVVLVVIAVLVVLVVNKRPVRRY